MSRSQVARRRTTSCIFFSTVSITAWLPGRAQPVRTRSGYAVDRPNRWVQVRGSAESRSRRERRGDDPQSRTLPTSGEARANHVPTLARLPKCLYTSESLSQMCGARARDALLSSPTDPTTQASGATDARARAREVEPERPGRARMVRTTARARSGPLPRPARPLRAARLGPFCHFRESIKHDPVPRAARFTSWRRSAPTQDQTETRGS